MTSGKLRQLKRQFSRLIRRFNRLAPDIEWDFHLEFNNLQGDIIHIEARWMYNDEELYAHYWVGFDWLLSHKKKRDIDRLLCRLLTSYQSELINYTKSKEKVEFDYDDRKEEHR